MKTKAIFLLLIFLLNIASGYGCILHMGGGCHNHYPKDASSIRHHHSGPSEISQHKSEISGIGHSNTFVGAGCCKIPMDEAVTGTKIMTGANNDLVKIAPLWFTVESYAFLFYTFKWDLRPARIIEDDYRPAKSDVRISIQSFQI